MTCVSEEDNAALRALYERGVKNGVPELRLLSGEEARALEGALSDQVTGALYAPTGAIVCPYELCIAAVGNAMDNGAELRLNFPVSSVRQTEEGYVLSDGANTVEARAVVNCAGIHADDVAALAGDATLHIHPRRGEYMLLDRECGNLLSHTVFQVPTKMGKGILVTPTVDGNLLVGPTAEDRTDKEDTSTSAAGLARVAQLARKSVPGVPLGKVITSFCGLRAVGSDGDFCIRSPRPHWIDCAGIESPGLSAAPAIAEYVTGMLAEQGMPL